MEAAKDKGLVVNGVMDEVQTQAAWTDANVNKTHAKKLLKHH